MELPQVCFNRSGEYFASSSEGELKVWNSKTGSLQQTIVSVHLQLGGVSCLAWSREGQGIKRRKSTHHKTPLIAAGLGSKVLVWNITKDNETVLKGHEDDVTCVDWDKNKLYSGSKDRHVMEWDVETGASTRRWKADKVGVQCICCYGDGSALLTAGRAIKLWSLQDYSLIKRVSGHASSINQLAFVGKDSFLSSAGNERIINFWQASGEGSTAVATLTCEEEVKMFASTVDDAGKVVKVAVVSDEGNLFLYELGSSALPSSSLSHTYSIQYVSSPPKPSTPSPLPVLAVACPAQDPHKITVAHSSCLSPVIESIEFEQPSAHTCLVRAVAASGLLLGSTQQSSSTARSSDKVTVLGPGNMTLPTHQLPSTLSGDQSGDLRPLLERMEPEARKQRGPAPTADSLTRLLVQSVASDDGKLMEEVLRVSKERVIVSTIKKLPVHTVLPFLKKLIELLQSSPARGLQLSVWIKTVFSAHAAYLMTVPQLSASLSGLHQLLEARVNTFSRLCQLQGKLDLMIAQGEAEVAQRAAMPSPADPTTEDGEDKDMGSDAEDWSSESSEEKSEEDATMDSDSSEQSEGET